MALTTAERQHVYARRLTLAASAERLAAQAAAAPPKPIDVDGCEVCGTERPACGAVEGCNRCGREFCAGCRGGDALCRECEGGRPVAVPVPTPADLRETQVSSGNSRLPLARKPKAPRRPQPPRALNEAECKLWKRLTREQDCSEWRHARLDALANYCRHMAMVELLSTRADGHSVDDMPGLGKLLTMRDREIRAAHASAKAWGEPT